jgi:hypothetical protein
MAKLTNFDPPANQNDFPQQPDLEEALRTLWDSNLRRFTRRTQQNDPWGSVNQPPLTDYYDPTQVDTPDGAPVVPIRWTAFPNRILISFPNAGQRKQWQYADEGPPDVDGQPYRPTGPRGWQDEYCEWSVTRNAAGKITKVSFTCENREYWYTLWQISPKRVHELYQELVGPQVRLEDLYLRDSNGNPIIDRETGCPAYDGRNRWNSSTTHGAVHLISNPNSLFAEIFLAGQATVLREDANGNPVTDKNQLINCSRYGTPNRNSDPTIGAAVNGLVRGTGALGSGLQVTLHNPVGLYIQEPSFDNYQLPFTAPDGAKASDYWHVVRGRRRRDGEEVDLILHAAYEVPEDQGFTVSDITINGFNIDFGSQITETFQIALAGTGIPQTAAPAQHLCATPSGHPLPQAGYLREADLLTAAIRGSQNCRVEAGTKVEGIGLLAFDTDRHATIGILGPDGVEVSVESTQPVQGGGTLFVLTLSIAENAEPGFRHVQLTAADGSKGPPVHGLLEVVPTGTLGKGDCDDNAAPLPAAPQGAAILHRLSVERSAR